MSTSSSEAQDSTLPPAGRAAETPPQTEISSVLQRTDADATGGVPSSSRVTPSTVDVGATLGVYRLEAKLGEGGMGAVYKALHTKLDKHVALKVLPAQLVSNPSLVSRFEREMKAVGKLEHPNIVRAMDAGEVAGTHYLVMEFVDGSDLSKLVQKRGPRPILEACEMIRQAALGLAHAHAHGLVHRDIKPSNLLLAKPRALPANARTPSAGAPTSHIKILDLGLALLQGEQGAGGGLTITGQQTVMGTPDYMAPEQWENTHTVDARADLYALGCTLCYLLTGKAPFDDAEHGSMVQKMAGHNMHAPPPLKARRPDVPDDVCALYDRLMAKKPAERIQTADDLAVALGNVIRRNKGSKSPTPVIEVPSSETPASRPGEPLAATRPMSSQVEPAAAGPTATGSPQNLPPTIAMPSTPSVAASIVKAGPVSPSSNGRRRLLLAAAGLVAVVLATGIILGIRNRDESGARIEVPEGGGVAVVQKGSESTGWHGWPADAPKPAIAPFDAAQAKKHQDEWAKYLGSSVVSTNSVGAKMVLIPPGEFLMGSTDAQVAAPFVAGSEYKDHVAKSERPQHRVILTKPVLMGTTEVTLGEFKKFVAATGYQTEAEQSTADPKPATFREPGYPVTDASPVSCVTWHDAVAYCRWLSGAEKVRYRLPTEAEWEFACRAGTTTQYFFGDDPADLDTYAQYTSPNKWGIPADARLPNPFGLRGTHGGVLEWCQDAWHANWYELSPAIDPQGPGAAFERTMRGGQGDRHDSLRNAFRLPRPANRSEGIIGFRIVRELVPAATSDLPVPQLASSVTTTSFSGLLNELPPLPGVKRWNVETRHARGQGSACWSPNSKFVAAGSGRQLRIYSAPDLKLVRILPEHTQFIGDWISIYGGGIAWSPDGKWLASADGTKIRLHNPHTGEAGPVLSGHPQPVWTIAWSADSQMLASGTPFAENIWLWSVDGTPLKRLPTPGPRRLVPHHKLPLLAAEDAGGKLSVWDLSTGQLRARLDSAAKETAWIEGGRLIFFSESEKSHGRIHSWTPKPDTAPVDLRIPHATVWFRVHPGSSHLLVAVGQDAFQFVDPDSGMAVGDAFPAVGTDVGGFSPDGRLLLTGGHASVGFSSPQLNAIVRNSGFPLTAGVYGFQRLAWNPKSDSLATDFGAPFRMRTIAHWNLGQTAQWSHFGQHSVFGIRFLAWLPDGRRLLCDAGMDGKPLRLWDPSVRVVEKNLIAFEKQTGSEAIDLAYSADGKQLAVIGTTQKIGLLDPQTFELKQLIDVKDSRLTRVMFVGSPPQLLAAHWYGASNQRWNAEKREWETLNQEPLWWSPDGNLGLHCGGGPVRLVDRSTGTTTDLEELPDGRNTLHYGGNNRPIWIIWSPDSQRFAVETDHHELAIYDRTGKFLRYLTGTSGITTVAQFAPDGSPRLAAAGDDNTLRVWNTDTGRQLWCGVQLSPDEAAILNDQGEVVFGDPATVERELIYLIEYDDGGTAVLTPSQFKVRFP